MEACPEYLSVDRERRLDEFIGHNCILVFHFPGLMALDQKLCASCYVSFKFFYHAIHYRTPRHMGVSCNPELNCNVRVEQRITADFLSFIREGSIEFEVFAKRRFPLHAPPATAVRVGEPCDIDYSFTAGQDPDAEAEVGVTAPVVVQEPAVTIEMVVQQLKDTTSKLRVCERLLQRSKKAAVIAVSSLPVKDDVDVIRINEQFEAEKLALRETAQYAEKRLHAAEKEIVELRKQVKGYKEKEKASEGEKLQLSTVKSKACVVQ
jgi:hypothetical protein